MWLHTVTNYQYAQGGTLRSTLRTLYGQGGVGRLYRGLVPTIVLSSLVRFGDIATNAGTLAVFREWETQSGKQVALPIQTAAASMLAALWRVCLTPLEVLKTNLMVSGPLGYSNLQSKLKTDGMRVAYYGSFAGFGLAWAAHYPWFVVFNHLQSFVPNTDKPFLRTIRNGLIGFSASSIAACTSNWIRVLKTLKQSNPDVHTYRDAVRIVLLKDGARGIFTRGLGTRIILQGLQGGTFTIIWKTVEDAFGRNDKSLKH